MPWIKTSNQLISGTGSSGSICCFWFLPSKACTYTELQFEKSAFIKCHQLPIFKGRENNINNNASKEGTTTEKVQKAPNDICHYEVDTKEFTIYTDKTLGSGEFGKVCRGKITKMDTGSKYVAVKMMKPSNVQRVAIIRLLSEIKVLLHVGQHENIVKMLGANTQNLRIGKVYIFLELCELGSLDMYLRKMRPHIYENSEIEDNQVAAIETPTSDKICTDSYVDVMTIARPTKNLLHDSLLNDMHRWSREICNGMTYLAYKQVVHADIATRNVLLNREKVAKICDFGLSHHLNNYESCAIKKEGPLPRKWISPEALRLLQFNEKSDVWAYGVTLWEIYTLGDEPYCGLTWDLSFVDMLDSGMRLAEPKYNDEKDMFSVMKKCWHTNPGDCPTFAEILQNF